MAAKTRNSAERLAFTWRAEDSSSAGLAQIIRAATMELVVRAQLAQLHPEDSKAVQETLDPEDKA